MLSIRKDWFYTGSWGFIMNLENARAKRLVETAKIQTIDGSLSQIKPLNRAPIAPPAPNPIAE